MAVDGAARDDIVGLDSAILQARRCGRRPATRPSSPTRSSTATTARAASGPTSSTIANAVPELRQAGHVHRAAPVQPDVQDVHGPGRGRGRHGATSARDRPGHLRQLPERPAHHAPEAAVRHRPDRQGVPQRDHPGQLHLPHPRVRADGDGVLLSPAEAAEWYEYWQRGAAAAGTSISASARRTLRLREHDADELAHYAARDLRHRVPIPVRLGRARGHRQPHRLRPPPAHRAHGQATCEYFDQEAERALHPVRHRAGRRRHPHHLGLPRRRLRRGGGRGETRTVLRFHPRLAPIKVAVFPLSRRTAMPEIATQIAADLRPPLSRSFYDVTQAIGRRYRRQDEIGTPFCVTVDFDTLDDRTVTVRDRDTMEQDRVADGPGRELPRRAPARLVE